MTIKKFIFVYILSCSIGFGAHDILLGKDSIDFEELPEASTYQNPEVFLKLGYPNCNGSCEARILPNIDKAKVLDLFQNYLELEQEFPIGTFTYPPLFGLHLGDEYQSLKPTKVAKIPIFDGHDKDAKRLESVEKYEEVEEVYTGGLIYFYGFTNGRLKIKRKSDGAYHWFDVGHVHSISGVSIILRGIYAMSNFSNGFSLPPSEIRYYDSPMGKMKIASTEKESKGFEGINIEVIDFKIKNNKIWLKVKDSTYTHPCIIRGAPLPSEVINQWIEYTGPEFFAFKGSC